MDLRSFQARLFDRLITSLGQVPLKQWEHQNTSIPWSGCSPGDFAPPILQYTGWTGSAQKLPQAPQPSQLVANPEPSFSDLRVLALKIKLIEALESTWPAPLAASPLRSPIARWKTSTTLGLTWAYIGRLGPCGPALEALEIRDRDRSYVLFCGTMPER